MVKPKLKASKEEKAQMKISRKELEEIIGRRLEDEEVRKLKRAKRKGILMRRRWIWRSSRAMISC
jgi:hypothetical protein